MRQRNEADADPPGVFVTDLAGRWRPCGSCRHVGFLDASPELGRFPFRGVPEPCWTLKASLAEPGPRELTAWRAEPNAHSWGGLGWKHTPILPSKLTNEVVFVPWGGAGRRQEKAGRNMPGGLLCLEEKKDWDPPMPPPATSWVPGCLPLPLHLCPDGLTWCHPLEQLTCMHESRFVVPSRASPLAQTTCVLDGSAWLSDGHPRFISLQSGFGSIILVGSACVGLGPASWSFPPGGWGKLH